MIKKLLLSLSKFERVLFLGFIVFAVLLMGKTFGATEDGNLRIAAKAWSDYAATLPLIRSFSYGDNFPPEYPIYSGPPIRYHFVFFAIVGFLERIGIRLDFAFNTLSVISFSLLLFAIYYLGKTIFKSPMVGALSSVLFLFNGSFGFLEYFKKHPLPEGIYGIFGNTDFSSFGPYDGKVVSAFWNLNIFTNQRHLALGYAFYLLFFLALFLFIRKPKTFSINKALILGALLGLFPFIHLSVFLMAGVTIIIFALLYSKARIKIILVGIVALALAIPQFLYMGSPEVETKLLKPGYLVNPLTLKSFLHYWFLNLGLTVILAPLGFLKASKEERKIVVPFLLFFVLGNLFQFSPDMPTNHKFFNLATIGFNFFTAFFLVKLTSKKLLDKLLAVFLIVPLTLTGFIDLFPIFNDNSIVLEDIPNNKSATFIKESTPRDSVFLNSSFLYDPASLAGRKIYLGWPYFSWSAGFDTTERLNTFNDIVSSESKGEFCNKLKEVGVDYVEVQNPSPINELTVNYTLMNELQGVVYKDAVVDYKIISTEEACK